MTDKEMRRRRRRRRKRRGRRRTCLRVMRSYLPSGSTAAAASG